MIFDKGSVIQLMRQGMTPAEKRQVSNQELALAVALDDLSLRLKSQNYLTSYTISVGASTRTQVVSGSNNDNRGIFAIKWGTGEDQKVLDYVIPEQFLREHDNPSATAATPDKYTILTASDSGWPTIKFDVPNETADTLTVYYYLELTPDSIAMANSMAAAVAGGAAYFHGTATEKGAAFYRQFEHLAALTRTQSPVPHVDTQFPLTREDREIRSVINTIRANRT